MSVHNNKKKNTNIVTIWIVTWEKVPSGMCAQRNSDQTAHPEFRCAREETLQRLSKMRSIKTRLREYTGWPDFLQSTHARMYVICSWGLYFVWSKPTQETSVFCIIDEHGRPGAWCKAALTEEINQRIDSTSRSIENRLGKRSLTGT